MSRADKLKWSQSFEAVLRNSILSWKYIKKNHSSLLYFIFNHTWMPVFLFTVKKKKSLKAFLQCDQSCFCRKTGQTCLLKMKMREIWMLMHVCVSQTGKCSWHLAAVHANRLWRLNPNMKSLDGVKLIWPDVQRGKVWFGCLLQERHLIFYLVLHWSKTTWQCVKKKHTYITATPKKH